MSVDTTVYIGWYVQAKCATIPEPELVYVCSGDITHQVKSNQKFCSHCGSHVITDERVNDEYLSAFDIQYGEAPNGTNVGDISYLKSNWTALSWEWAGMDHGTDIVFFDKTMINFDPEQQTQYDFDPSDKPLSTEVETLVRIMKYTSFELKYGCIVTYS